MKRFIIVILASLMLLCGCQKNEEKTKKAPETKSEETSVPEKEPDSTATFDLGEKPELEGIYNENIDLWYLDPEAPLKQRFSTSVDVTLSNGKKDTSYINIPILNADIEGANALSDEIAADLEAQYAEYFADPDDKIVKVDYSPVVHTDRDLAAVIISHQIITPEEETKFTTVYYYDLLSDVDLNTLEYVNLCGSQISEIYGGLLETEWAAEYESATGEAPTQDGMTCIIYKSGKEFDVYFTNPDGKTETVVSVTALTTDLQIPGM